MELKAAIKLVGMFEMKPTVSTNSTVKLQGSLQACTVTSKVANSASLGSNLLSPVKALINVVLPVLVKESIIDQD